MNESRRKMIQEWGSEIVVQCCRYWKLHWANGRWGHCGICREKPEYVNLTWDQLDQLELNE